MTDMHPDYDELKRASTKRRLEPIRAQIDTISDDWNSLILRFLHATGLYSPTLVFGLPRAIITDLRNLTRHHR